MQAGGSWGNGKRCALPVWALTLGAATITRGSGRQELPGHVPLSWALTLRLAVQFKALPSLSLQPLTQRFQCHPLGLPSTHRIRAAASRSE
eukprot:5536121-Pyramimonas_sp.AAC.1